MTAHIGIDPSTNDIAFVALNGENVLMRSYALNGREIATRVGAAYNVTQRFLIYLSRQWGEVPVLTSVEAPVAVRNRQTLIKLSQVNGAIIAALVRAGVVPWIVAPSTWKKEVVGNGNANKQAVEKWVRDEWSEFHHRAAGDQDTLDAACIARYTEIVDRRAGHLGMAVVEE